MNNYGNYLGQYNPYGFYDDMNDYIERYLNQDYGPNPLTINIDEVTIKNNNFRIVIWTGEHLQITLMSINVGESIGLELHPKVDQFIKIEQGIGVVQMGDNKNNFNYERVVMAGDAVVVPSGKWHNLINTGNVPIKLYSIYAPPNHPKRTIQVTKEEADH